MSKKERQSMEELWSKRFDEEAEINEEPLSRKAKREREKSISPILTVTLIFLALLIILPTSAYVWWSSQVEKSEDPATPTVEQVADNSETEEADAPSEDESSDPADDDETSPDVSDEEETDEPDETASDTTGERSEADSTEDRTEETVAETPAESDSEAQDSEPQESAGEPETVEQPAETEEALSQSSGADYYTVESGDNMYRIALNHGLSTEELMQLNGLQDETVFVGQELRVE